MRSATSGPASEPSSPLLAIPWSGRAKWGLVLAALAGALGFALTIWAYAPGLLSPDSLWQLEQARQRIYTDSHPPVMAWLWSFLAPARHGPSGMLILQAAVFWSADVLLWVTLLRGRRDSGSHAEATLGVLAFGLLPPVFGLLGTIWKDVEMGLALFAAGALVIAVLGGRNGRWLLVPGAVLLWYASAVRFNGILAAAPLIWLWVRAASPAAPARRIAALSAAAIAAVAVLAFGANRLLTSTDDHLSQQYEVHDLAALSLDEGRSLFPDAYWGNREPIGLEQIAKLYHPVEPSFLFWSGVAGPHFRILTNDRSEPSPPELSALRWAWLGAVANHPARFLRHRLRTLKDLLGVGTEQVCYAYQPDMQSNALGVRLARPQAHALAIRYLARFRDGLLFRGWVYVLALLGLLATSIWGPTPSRVVAALSASGLLNLAAYPLVGTGCDFRYLWWSALAVWMALVVLATGDWRRRIAIEERS